jgi:tetratricopeptide (TPR) repeat protein
MISTIQEASSAARSFYDKGMAALERNNLDYAMDMFTAALEQHPELLEVRKLLRSAALNQQRENPAKGPSIGTALIALKTQLLLKKQIHKAPLSALHLIEQRLRKAPTNLHYIQLLCRAAKAASLPEIAIQELEMARDRSPKELAILEPLAELYRQEKRFDNEYECRKQIALLKPNDSLALKQLKDAAAHNTMETAGWEKAKSFREIIKPMQQNEEPHRAPAQPDEHPEEPALSALLQAEKQVEHYPNDLAYRYQYGELLYHEQRYNEALQQLQAAQQSPKNRILSLYYLGLCFKEKRQNDIAIQQFETALASHSIMDDTRKKILYELASLCELTHQPERATTLFKEIYMNDIRFRDVADRIDQAYGQ